MPHRKPPPRRPGGLEEPYVPGDRIPTPEATEESSDSAWQLWSSLAEKQQAHFADTTPARALEIPRVDTRYAKTEPAPLRGDAVPTARPAGARAVTVDEAMQEARRNNRLCPRPVHWQRVYAMLPDKQQTPRGWLPAPPISGNAWTATPSLAKRMCLRDHIEWADRHGCLAAVLAALKDLPEDQWHHMGD